MLISLYLFNASQYVVVIASIQHQSGDHHHHSNGKGDDERTNERTTCVWSRATLYFPPNAKERGCNIVSICLEMKVRKGVRGKKMR